MKRAPGMLTKAEVVLNLPAGLNDKGIKTAQGKKWSAMQLKRVVGRVNGK
jgi:hypothetical protein